MKTKLEVKNSNNDMVNFVRAAVTPAEDMGGSVLRRPNEHASYFM